MSDFSSKRTERHTDPLPHRKLPADYRPPCCLFTVRSDRHTAGNTYSSAMLAELTLDSLTASQIHYCLFQLYSWSADGLPSVNLVCCVHIPFHTQRLTQMSMWPRSVTAPESFQVGENTITQKHLFIGLFVIGIPMFLVAGPIGTAFWLIGASSVLILGHACLLEPGVESDYATIGETV